LEGWSTGKGFSIPSKDQKFYDFFYIELVHSDAFYALFVASKTDN